MPRRWSEVIGRLAGKVGGPEVDALVAKDKASADMALAAACGAEASESTIGDWETSPSSRSRRTHPIRPSTLWAGVRPPYGGRTNACYSAKWRFACYSAK